MRHYELHHVLYITSSRRRDMRKGSRLLFLYRYCEVVLGVTMSWQLRREATTTVG